MQTPAHDDETDGLTGSADMLAVATLILSVIYAEGSYDAWDLGLSLFAIWLCGRRLWRIRNEPFFDTPRVMARLGVALSLYVFSRVFLNGLWETYIEALPLQEDWIQAEYPDVIVVSVVFGLISLLDRWLNPREL